MRTIVLTSKGIEPFVVEELSQWGVAATAADRIVFFDAQMSIAAMVAYKSQMAHRIGRVLFETTTSDVLSVIKSELPDATKDLEGPIKVDSLRFGDHAFNSVQVKEVAKQVVSRVTFSKGDHEVFVLIVDDYVAICEDIAGLDLSKRDYKVFSSSFSIKGPVGAALTFAAGWNQEDVLLDPYCRDGTLAIEAALRVTRTSPRKFEKRKLRCREYTDFDLLDEDEVIKGTIIASDPLFPNLAAAKKNAKIASVQKAIEFRKYAIDDLDLSIEPESVGAIATSTRTLPDVFFERAKQILMPKAKIAALLQKDEGVVALAQKHGFVLVDKSQFWLGKKAHPVVIFQKS